MKSDLQSTQRDLCKDSDEGVISIASWNVVGFNIASQKRTGDLTSPRLFGRP